MGIDERNRTSDVQQVTITFKDGELKQQKDVTDGVSILLFVPESIYIDMEFLAVAEVLFCDPTNQYQFQWDFINNTRIQGKNFKMLPGEISTEKLTKIKVSLINSTKTQQIITSVS